MAELKGVNVTKYDAGTKQDNWIDQGLIKSDIKIWTDSFEAAGAAIADTIVIAQLPDGAIVHDIQIGFDDLGTSVTLDCGDSTDPNRYFSAIDAATAAAEKASILVDGMQYKIGTATGDGKVYLTVAGGAATGTIKTVVYYTN